jgi:hypothetical protein
MRGWLIAALLALCAGAGPARAADSLALHPDVFAAFETYSQSLRPGAFAVSEDGASFGQSRCTSGICDPVAQKRAALQSCRAEADAPCVIFATGANIQRAYRLLTRADLSACPLDAVPTIRVAFTARDTLFDHSRTVADLSHLMFDDERHWIDEDGTAMGVTSQFFDIDHAAIGYAEIEGRDGARCVGYRDGEIELTLGATIYVAKELPEDSCLYREVLAHEHKHRDLGRTMTEAFGRDLEAAIAAALAEEPYVVLPANTMPWRVADERLLGIIDAVYAKFMRNHSRRQLAIDSNAEYMRVDDACPGETAKYVPLSAAE